MTYVYHCPDACCENTQQTEIVRPASDDTPVLCPICEQPMKRVMQPVAVAFKGSGFYSTDNPR
jgi:putative FmdB family regulatory protein